MSLNTIIAPKVFAKETIRLLDKENIFLSHVDRKYEGEITKAGDSVRVQTLPKLTFTAQDITGAGDMSTAVVGSGPGGAIAASAFALTLENIIVNRYTEKLITIDDFESTQSNQPLESQVAGRYAEGLGTLFDTEIVTQILVTDVATIPAANKITEAAARSVDNIYNFILAQRAALKKQHVKVANMELFVGVDTETLLLESSFLKGSDVGAGVFMNGYIGTVAGVPIYTSTELDASDDMIMMTDESVNMVVQMIGTNSARGTDGNYTNVWSTAVWGLKIFAEKAKSISISSPFA
tara:strand:+ start:1671 stop:2552 length:882 start_codon:yes stop_codon:yes gene_type:complete